MDRSIDRPGAAAVVALWFLIFDISRGRPLRELLPGPITLTPQVGADGSLSWTITGFMRFEGVAVYLDGHAEERRIEQAITGQVKRPGSPCLKLVPPAGSDWSYTLRRATIH